MRGTNIKTFEDSNGQIVKAEVERYINGEMVSQYTLHIGSVLIVNPLNKQKLKHRNRKVQVLGFKEDDERDQSGDLKVKVKFLDNNRKGVIPINDLDVDAPSVIQ